MKRILPIFVLSLLFAGCAFEAQSPGENPSPCFSCGGQAPQEDADSADQTPTEDLSSDSLEDASEDDRMELVSPPELRCVAAPDGSEIFVYAGLDERCGEAPATIVQTCEGCSTCEATEGRCGFELSGYHYDQYEYCAQSSHIGSTSSVECIDNNDGNRDFYAETWVDQPAACHHDPPATERYPLCAAPSGECRDGKCCAETPAPLVLLVPPDLECPSDTKAIGQVYDESPCQCECTIDQSCEDLEITTFYYNNQCDFDAYNQSNHAFSGCIDAGYLSSFYVHGSESIQRCENSLQRGTPLGHLCRF